jgi:hypothetical protein
MWAERYNTQGIFADIGFRALSGILLPFMWRIFSISRNVKRPSQGQLSRLALC